jgi:hydroxyethylthiazole kinase-like uncharacterized protein yjeF
VTRKGRIGFLETDNSASQGPSILPPLVIDADGLTLLAKEESWAKALPANCVLTPHPGELAALTGLTIEQIQTDRIGIATKYAMEWKQIIVLKGALTVIATPDGRLFIVPVATSALAKAGTGDVLAGMITGLRAQGLGAVEAAVCGAWIHAQAGLAASDWAGDDASVMASDVIDAVGEILAGLR